MHSYIICRSIRYCKVFIMHQSQGTCQCISKGTCKRICRSDALRPRHYPQPRPHQHQGAFDLDCLSTAVALRTPKTGGNFIKTRKAIHWLAHAITSLPDRSVCFTWNNGRTERMPAQQTDHQTMRGGHRLSPRSHTETTLETSNQGRIA